MDYKYLSTLRVVSSDLLFIEVSVNLKNVTSKEGSIKGCENVRI